MENPWKSLPETKPFVIPDDAKIIKEFNNRCANQDHVLQIHVLPEPFIGNPNSSVYLLSLNPGYSNDDLIWHSKKDFASAIKANLRHELAEYTFYFLNPQFHESPGAHWWLRKLRPLIKDSSIDTVSNNLFCVELFGYHSVKYKEIPKTVSESLLPSQRYAVFLVRQAMKRNVKIVVMRSYQKWIKVIPELKFYGNCYSLNNPQNVVVSPNNLNEYDCIVAEFSEIKKAIPAD